MKKVLLFLSLVPLIYACTNKWGDNVKLISKTEVTYTDVEQIYNYGEIALKPSEIIMCDSLLIILDQTPNDILKIYNINSGQTRSFVSQGRAKGEVLGAYDIDYIRETNEIAVLDVTTSTILFCALDSIDVKEYYPNRSYNLMSSGFNLFTNVTIDGTSIYCSGCFDELRFFKYDMFNCKVIDSISYCPNAIGEDVDRYINQAYMGTIQYNHATEKVVIGCRYADQLEIYDTRAKTVQYVKGPLLFEPDYHVVGTSTGQALAHSEEERKGYIDIATNDHFIYALYSGRTRQDGKSSYGNEIRKFTWEGEYVTSYMLNQDILSFDADNSDQIYTINYNGEIIQYALK